MEIDNMLTKFLCFIFMFCSCAQSAAVRENPTIFRRIVDSSIQSIRNAIEQADIDQLPLPALYYKWDYGWQFLTLDGHINCTNGTVGPLSNIKRIGDIKWNIEASDNETLQATLSARIALPQLNIHFVNCEMRAERLFSYEHDLNGTTDFNWIDLVLNFTVGEDIDCKATVEQDTLNQILHTDLDIGGGPVNTIKDKFIEWFPTYFQTAFVTKLNGIVDEVIPKIHLCSKIPYFLFRSLMR